MIPMITTRYFGKLFLNPKSLNFNAINGSREIINQERIKLAKQLLAKPQDKVQTVSNMCGFSDVNYFVRLFKKMEGITPKAYKDCMMAN